MRKFKLGVMTDEVSQHLDEVIAFALKYKLDTLEIRSIMDRPVHKLSDEELIAIRRQTDAAGLNICALSSPIFKCDLDNEEELLEHDGLIEQYIHAAKLLGARMIRGFSFWAKGSFEEHKEDIAAHIRRAARRLEAEGLLFLLEFDPSVYATNARKTAALIELIQADNVRVLYDPGNALWDPEGEIPYPDSYRYVKDQMAHIHLKDAIRKKDGPVGVAIGRGEVDYKGLFQTLIDDGYSGYLIVETHYRLTSLLSEEQLKRPSGQSFSAGGLEASEECIEALLAMEHFH